MFKSSILFCLFLAAQVDASVQLQGVPLLSNLLDNAAGHLSSLTGKYIPRWPSGQKSECVHLPVTSGDKWFCLQHKEGTKQVDQECVLKELSRLKTLPIAHLGSQSGCSVVYIGGYGDTKNYLMYSISREPEPDSGRCTSYESAFYHGNCPELDEKDGL